MRPWFCRPVIYLLIITTFMYSGCVVLVEDLVVAPVHDTYDGVITTGLRVHTDQGEVLLFDEGARITPDSLFGEGKLYGLNLEDGATSVTSWSRARVVAMEYVDAEVDKKDSAVLSSIGTVAILGAIGIVMLYIAVANAFSYLDGTPDGD